jgi:plasmid stability protein
MQYTIRNVPKKLDVLLRDRAKKEGKSLNQVVLEAIARALSISDEPARQRDLSELAGTWIEDLDFDRAIQDQDRVDEDLWR